MMTHSSQSSRWQNTKICLSICLVLVFIYSSIFIFWRIYQYRAVSELVQAIESFDEEQTEVAIEKVKTRDATELALPKLIALLESDEKVANSRVLVWAFSGTGPAGVSRLLEMIKPTENINTRVKAMSMFSWIVRDPFDGYELDAYELQQVTHVLVQTLNDEHRYARFSAAQAISIIDPAKADETLPTLVEFMRKDPDVEIRFNAASCIGHFGQQAEVVLPDLLQALKDPAAVVRICAARAICKIGIADQKVIDAFTEMLLEEDLSCRRSAAYSLGKLGSQSISAIPALIDSLKSLKVIKQDGSRNSIDQEITRSDFVDALGEIGHASSEVIQTLIATLNDKRLSISRESAAIALGKLGPQAVSAVPDLIKVRDESEKDSKLSLEAAIALEHIDLKKFNRFLDESNTNHNDF